MRPTERSIHRLRALLREEVSAVETYHQVLGHIRHTGLFTRLQACLQSHQRRIQLLEQRLEALGKPTSPKEGRGTGFARVTQSGVENLREGAAVEALAEGESYELRDYELGLEDLDEESRRYVEEELLPAQRWTHDTVHQLKHAGV